jgi:hypothetical protein
MWIKQLGDVPKDSITGWEIKNNMNIHCLVATGSGLGRSRMYTIQVHPSWKLQVDWTPLAWLGGGRCPGWRGTGLCSTWFHMGQAGRAPQYTDFFCIAHWTQLHIWRTGQGPLTPHFFPVGHRMYIIHSSHVTVWLGCPRFKCLAWSSEFTHTHIHRYKGY